MRWCRVGASRQSGATIVGGPFQLRLEIPRRPTSSAAPQSEPRDSSAHRAPTITTSTTRPSPPPTPPTHKPPPHTRTGSAVGRLGHLSAATGTAGRGGRRKAADSCAPAHSTRRPRRSRAAAIARPAKFASDPWTLAESRSMGACRIVALVRLAAPTEYNPAPTLRRPCVHRRRGLLQLYRATAWRDADTSLGSSRLAYSSPNLLRLRRCNRFKRRDCINSASACYRGRVLAVDAFDRDARRDAWLAMGAGWRQFPAGR